jgi:hypothetical protein
MQLLKGKEEGAGIVRTIVREEGISEKLRGSQYKVSFSAL